MKKNDALRKELIQVAAVAVEIISDMDEGHTMLSGSQDVINMGEIFVDVSNERFKQFEKWGNQHHSAKEWMVILAEEFGETVTVTRENTPITDDVELEALLTAAANLEWISRQWLQNHDWEDPRHKEIHEGERDGS